MLSSKFLFVALLLLNKGAVSGREALGKNSAFAKTSLTLCGLETEVVTVVVVRHLDFAAAGKRKSLSRSLMCLDFSHFYSPSLRGVPYLLTKLFFLRLDRRENDRHISSL